MGVDLKVIPQSCNKVTGRFYESDGFDGIQTLPKKQYTSHHIRPQIPFTKTVEHVYLP